MGRVFIDHPGGTRVYCCANCDTALTNRGELVSTVRELTLLVCIIICFNYRDLLEQLDEHFFLIKCK